MLGDRQANGLSSAAVVVVGAAEPDEFGGDRIDRREAHHSGLPSTEGRAQRSWCTDSGRNTAGTRGHAASSVGNRRLHAKRSRWRCSMTSNADAKAASPSAPRTSDTARASSSLNDATSRIHCSVKARQARSRGPNRDEVGHCDRSEMVASSRPASTAAGVRTASSGRFPSSSATRSRTSSSNTGSTASQA